MRTIEFKGLFPRTSLKLMGVLHGHEMIYEESSEAADFARPGHHFLQGYMVVPESQFC